MRRRTAWRVRNNPLEIDLFERSSQTPEATETDSTFDPTEPVEMARNDEGNARKRLSDYARPVLQRPVTRIHAPLGRGANFRIDSHVMSMLPIFLGKPSKYPYRHVDELSQVCEINSLWIRPLFTIIPLNSIHFHQIGKFGIIFHVIPREIDDLAVSSRQMAPLPGN